jgi:hypothetical protein
MTVEEAHDILTSREIDCWSALDKLKQHPKEALEALDRIERNIHHLRYIISAGLLL